MKSYLRRHLFDGERLRRRTVKEFATAVRSGRLIAFVGSYATKDAGYPDWNDFLKAYAHLAQEFVKKIKCRTSDAQRLNRIDHVDAAIKSLVGSLPANPTDSAKKWDNALASLSIIEQALEYLEEGPGPLQEELDRNLQRLFSLTALGADVTKDAERISRLGIDRVITLNYDLEFEWLWMTTADEKMHGLKNRNQLFLSLIRRRDIQELEDISLMRILPSGRSAISDVFSRERIDRLIEFAVGSPDYETHVLHLHGVVLDPKTMVISHWDYNRQYRRSGVSKLPFQHALRVLFAGNPILFIGVGMSERDVTATLEQIVSDHPDRRIAPAFLIWNAPTNSDGSIDKHEKEAFRFRWLHRFDVLTIFDDEILDGADRLGTEEEKFSASIENLGKLAVDIVTPYKWQSADFRSIRKKLSAPSNLRSGHFDIYPAIGSDPLDEMIGVRGDGIVLFIDKPGRGKGHWAQAYRHHWHRLNAPREPVVDRLRPRSMLINASFVFEIESVFTLISGLGDLNLAIDQGMSRRDGLRAFFEGRLDQAPPPLLFVINGMERFFTPDGQPLSTELDALLRSVINRHNWLVRMEQLAAVAASALPSNQAATASVGVLLDEGGSSAPAAIELAAINMPQLPRFEIVVFGTNRVHKYFKSLKIDARDRLISQPELPTSVNRDMPSEYFYRVCEAFGDFRPTAMQQAAIDRKCKGDITELRRHFLAAYLQTEALKNAGARNADLCFDIITVMGYIGQPVEDAVLFHAPRIRQRLSKKNPRAAARELQRALDDLVRLHLLLPRGQFEAVPDSWGWKRYGLHRSVLTEIRDRVGIPLSDSKLSAGFNLSLYAAQPVDGYSPEPEIHEELDVLIDWFIGAYKDQSLNDSLAQSSVAPAPAGVVDEMHGRERGHSSACLRAALAIVRNYYSTSTLLTVDLAEDDDGSEIDAPLSQHAERLDRLIEAAEKNAEARRNSAVDEDQLGPAPFYPDDLVWLLNERGVVKLTQGDLYEARHSFDQALRLNELVEFGDRGHNWRHLMLNQLHVDFERARLERAEERIGDIEQSISQHYECSFDEFRECIVERYGQGVSNKVHVVDPEYEHDVLLTAGLLFGYRGLCLHTRGELKLAFEMFEVCVNILQNIGEHRAYAIFQRHFALLKAGLGKSADAQEGLRLAIASAEATRQIDVARQARISLAWHSHAASEESVNRAAFDRATLINRLQRSLKYAEAFEMHRVRAEASLNLARVKFEGGDFDSALERVADAMAIATRYGMSLRKIALRILMGQILMRRGDHRSGAKLIERAMRNAERVGYQGAVGLAQRVVELEESPATKRARL